MSALDDLLEDTFYLVLNANDVFAWACADSVTLDREDIPVALEARERWGFEGHLAVLSEIAGIEPHQPLLNRIDQEKFRAAREHLKGKLDDSRELDRHNDG